MTMSTTPNPPAPEAQPQEGMLHAYIYTIPRGDVVGLLYSTPQAQTFPVLPVPSEQSREGEYERGFRDAMEWHQVSGIHEDDPQVIAFIKFHGVGPEPKEVNTSQPTSAREPMAYAITYGPNTEITRWLDVAQQIANQAVKAWGSVEIIPLFGQSAILGLNVDPPATSGATQPPITQPVVPPKSGQPPSELERDLIMARNTIADLAEKLATAQRYLALYEASDHLVAKSGQPNISAGEETK